MVQVKLKSAFLKFISKTVVLLLFLLGFAVTGTCQYDWKLNKNKDGIRVYLSEIPGSSFKSIKVECTLAGTYDKLVAILMDVDHLGLWAYNTKRSFVLKRTTALDLVYYTETIVPWPMSNRDVVVHMKINRDSLPRFLKVTGVGEPNHMAVISSKVRIPHLSILWNVTMPTAKTIKIVYILEADPGGSVPAWLVNSFATKGPYESFKKLSVLLKK